MIRLFKVSLPTGLVFLIILEILLVSMCYVGAGLLALNPELDPWFYFRDDGGWLQLLITIFSIEAGFYFLDMHDLRPVPKAVLLQQICLVLGFAFLTQALLGYLDKPFLQMPQWTMLFGSGALLLIFPLFRTFYYRLIRDALPKQRLLFVGASPLLPECLAMLQERPEFGFVVDGYLGRPLQELSALVHLGAPETIREIVKDRKPDRVVVSLTEPDSLPTQDLLDLRISGLHIEEVNALYEQLFGRVSLKTLKPEHLILARELQPRPWTLWVQTIYSFIGGLVGFLLTAPVMLLVALAVRLTSPGPILYSQVRVGLAGAKFRLYKFRSMYADAEKRTGPVWATKNDPRVTPLGRWLRRLRLDELPQFFNVLRGEMSLVGPRPERPEFCAKLEEQIPFFHQRHSVKPGITGWAQINHKYAETIEDTATKLEYDFYYVKHLSPALDAYIIFHTVKVMLLSRGGQ